MKKYLMTINILVFLFLGLTQIQQGYAKNTSGTGESAEGIAIEKIMINDNDSEPVFYIHASAFEGTAGFCNLDGPGYTNLNTSIDCVLNAPLLLPGGTNITGITPYVDDPSESSCNIKVIVYEAQPGSPLDMSTFMVGYSTEGNSQIHMAFGGDSALSNNKFYYFAVTIGPMDDKGYCLFQGVKVTSE